VEAVTIYATQWMYQANNANGKMSIRSSLALGALNKRNSPFCNYFDDNRVYVNNAKLGDEEGIALVWISGLTQHSASVKTSRKG
jgi:hypothetical protein